MTKSMTTILPKVNFKEMNIPPRLAPVDFRLSVEPTDFLGSVFPLTASSCFPLVVFVNSGSSSLVFSLVHEEGTPTDLHVPDGVLALKLKDASLTDVTWGRKGTEDVAGDLKRAERDLGEDCNMETYEDFLQTGIRRHGSLFQEQIASEALIKA